MIEYHPYSSVYLKQPLYYNVLSAFLHSCSQVPIPPGAQTRGHPIWCFLFLPKMKDDSLCPKLRFFLPSRWPLGCSPPRAEKIRSEHIKYDFFPIDIVACWKEQCLRSVTRDCPKEAAEIRDVSQAELGETEEPEN